ncbi:DUF1223 domain-containing protein [Pelagibacterium sp. 26DY04]|uniref:DUF1223 domain-containing protein n=1 Tax=Pelagibacterium sp. 26DY04 TaxID=2967130 RepID=UPI0028154C98|nr:DUF1223 domain-containing protein [Pelagibacterium sp. 26DY04]WMT86459.1 DUF1223 domain-containing protein [Pelagibacterium sp. 26DY04]
MTVRSSPRIEWLHAGFILTKNAMRVPVSQSARLVLRLYLAAMTCLAAGAAYSLEIRDRPNAVVELFTSQGCPPCPAADQLLSRMSDENNVIALAYHVNYWDYTGWADTFAISANGELQKAYASASGTNRLYTPQMIVNGARSMAGSNAEEVLDALAEADLALSMDVEAESQDVVILRAGPRSGLGAAVVWLVAFRNSAEVEVTGGDNMGQRLSYSHIVTSRQPVGMWDPSSGAEIRIPVPEALGPDNDGFALIIQEKNGALPGRILGAAAVMR